MADHTVRTEMMPYYECTSNLIDTPDASFQHSPSLQSLVGLLLSFTQRHPTYTVELDFTTPCARRTRPRMRGFEGIIITFSPRCNARSSFQSATVLFALSGLDTHTCLQWFLCAVHQLTLRGWHSVSSTPKPFGFSGSRRYPSKPLNALNVNSG